MVNKEILFYDSGSCPYAHRTWLALVELALPFETRKVDLRNKSEEFQSLYHSVYPDSSVPAKVPIIVDTDGTTLIESDITVKYLDDKYGPRLLPSGAAERAKVLLFADVFSTRVLPYIYGLLRASTPEAVAHVQALDAIIRRHGSEAGGAFFLGGRYSFAETSASPFVRRLLVVLPHYRSYDAAAIAAERLPRLHAWIEACMARPSLKQTGPSDAELIDAAKKFVSG